MTTPISVTDLDKFVAELAELRKQKELKEAELSEIEGNIRKAKEQSIAYLTELKRENYKSPDGTISIVDRWRVSTPKTDEEKQKFFDFLTDKDLFYKYATVNSNSLNSLYMEYWKSAREAGEMDFDMPGVSKPELHRDISFRKA